MTTARDRWSALRGSCRSQQQPASAMPLVRGWLVHPLSQLLLDLLEFCSHSVAPGLPLKEELASTRRAADKAKSQEIEGFRFANPALGAPSRRVATELDQAGLFRMQR